MIPTWKSGLLLLLACAPLAAREPAPAPYCMDAREVAEAWQSDTHTVAVRLNDESRFRLELADACPVPEAGDEPRLLAPAGWVCGSNEEKLQVGGRECAVSGIARIDAREFAELASAASRRVAAGPDVGSLDPVVVTERRARRGRGFGGTTAYCFDARFVRGWNEDGDGLVVETSPRRSGGNRYYRVELERACPELSRYEGLRFSSGVGMAAICGHPGDRVLPVRTGTMPLGTTISLAGAASIHEAGDARDTMRGVLPGSGCPIARVYPILGR